jgi:hypothetical protein
MGRALVAAAAVLQAFATAPKIDRNRFEADLDRVADRHPRHRDLLKCRLDQGLSVLP